MSRLFFLPHGEAIHDVKINDPPDNDERIKLERKLERAMLAYWRDDVVPAVLREAESQRARQQMPGMRSVDDVLSSFKDDMSRIVLPILEQGAQNGAENAGANLEKIGIGIDMSLVNRDVLKWARKHGAELVRGITKTTRQQIREAITNWIEAGDPLRELEKKLAVSFGRKRAELIASTEVTRVYAQGNQQAWVSSGVVEAKVWRTVRDERVCPICEPLDNKVVELEGAFDHPDDKIAAKIGAVVHPPAHPRCRCWISPKVMGMPAEEAQPRIQRARQRNAVAPTTDAEGKLEKSQQFIERDDKPQSFYAQVIPIYDVDTRVNAKDKIVDELSGRTEASYGDVNDYLAQWASTSNDLDLRSLGIQEDAADLFGVELSKWQKGKLAEAKDLNRLGSGHNYIFASDKTPESIDKAKRASKSILQAMYDYTQEELKKGDIDTLVLYRGIRLDNTGLEVGDVIGFDSNVLESWSTNKHIANGFGNVVIQVEVPADRVIGSCRTGFGCLDEHEVVILGNIPGDSAEVIKSED